MVNLDRCGKPATEWSCQTDEQPSGFHLPDGSDETDNSVTAVQRPLMESLFFTHPLLAVWSGMSSDLSIYRHP